MSIKRSTWIKQLLMFVATSTSTVSVSVADPTYMIGVNISLSGDVGVTAKLLHDDRKGSVVAAFGASYFPFAEEQFDVDLGVGYNFDHVTPVVSWGVFKSDVLFNIGYSGTDDPGSSASGSGSPTPSLDPAPPVLDTITIPPTFTDGPSDAFPSGT